MRVFFLRQRRDGRRHAARARDAKQARTQCSIEEDHVVSIPAPAAAGCRVGQLNHRAASDRDLLQLAPGKEADKPAVGRPEGKRGALGPLNRAGFRAGHGSQPETEHRLGTGHERDVATIRGDRQLCVVASTAGARTSEGGVLGRRDGELDHVLGLRRGGTPHSQRNGRSGDERDRRQRSDQPRDTRGSRGHGRRRSKAGLVIQHEQRCRDVADSLAAILDQALPQQRSNRRGDIGREGLPGRLEADHRAEHVGHVFAVKGASPRQHLVQHAAECPDVAALVGLSSLRLLRRHVRGGAEDDARAGQHGRARDGRR